MKKITATVLIFILMLSLTGCGAAETEDNGKIKIISTIFPQYDFAKTIAGEKCEVSMLLPPSAESHSFEPTPKDIMEISECDLFIYVGGHSEHWIEEILDSLDNKPNILIASEYVELLSGQHGGRTEFDEHIWTTPENAKLISMGICDMLCEISPENAEYFKNNLNGYTEELENLDREISEVTENAERKTLVFGDKFPFRYFADKYSLEWISPYSDCGSEAEPSAKMVAEITDKVVEEKIPVVLYIEFSNHKVADSIAESAKVKAMELHSGHNVTKEQLENGISYVDLMKKNIKVLKEALY